jgi:hypothetical protein
MAFCQRVFTRFIVALFHKITQSLTLLTLGVVLSRMDIIYYAITEFQLSVLFEVFSVPPTPFRFRFAEEQ